LELPSGVSESQAIPFSWKATGHLGRNYRLVVQRPVGTSHTWKTMLRLRTRKGSAELPGQKLGTYRFRLAALRGNRVLAQQVADIGVYGQVPFSVLFGERLNSGVYAAAATSFPYVGTVYPSDSGAAVTAFSVEHNHCSAVHIGFVLGNTHNPEEAAKNSSSTGIVTVVQQSQEAVTASAPFNATGSVDVNLIPGQTWSLLIREQKGDPTLPYYNKIFFNGYAICDSRESFF
jgi:hypothetical protein